MSRVLLIARQDLRHALRDRLIWGALLLLGLMFLPSTAAVVTSGHRDIGDLLLTIPLDLITFTLVVVAAAGYNAVVGERVTGAVRTVLGLSATRRDLVIGKVIARATIVVLALTIVLAVANVLVTREYGIASLVPFWVMAGWMLVYGIVWTAVTVGYSAAFATQYRTLGALVATYATFSPTLDIWSVVVRPMFSLAFTGSLTPPAYDRLAAAPLWLQVTERLNPMTGFFRAMHWSIETVGPGTPTAGIGLQFFGTVVFLCFGVIGLVGGIRRFERTDLCRDESRSWLERRLRWPVRTIHIGIPVVRRVSTSSGRTPRALTIARADLRHAFQHWVVTGSIALFALLVAPQLWTGLDPSSISTPLEQIAGIPDTFGLPVLVLGIASGYGAVVGERESGTVRLILGTAGTRAEIVVGKLVARLVVVAIAVAPVILFAELLVLRRFGELYPVAFLAWAGWILGYALVWTAFVVGISTAFSTRYRTIAAIFGTYLLFAPGIGLWNPLVRPLFSFLFTGRLMAYESYVNAQARVPLWFSDSEHLNPLIALQTVREGLFILAGHGTQFMYAPPALFLFGCSISLLFAAGPLYLGYQRFAGSDLD